MGTRRRSEPGPGAAGSGGRPGPRSARAGTGRRGRPGAPRARLFVALDLPPAHRAAIADWRDAALAGRDELRLVAREALHVTLCFLGWTAERDVERVAELTATACAGLATPELTAHALAPLPARRPRLLALQLEDRDGRAGSAQAAVSGALAEAGLYEPERRPFWPHLTVARVKRGARIDPPDAPPPPGEPFAAPEVTVYKSTLRPQGALYEPLAGTVIEV